MKRTQWTVQDLIDELSKLPKDLLINLEDSDGHSAYALNTLYVLCNGELMLSQHQLEME
jgi:hypothetical protein